jgi:type I restriction enzyme, S subunit
MMNRWPALPLDSVYDFGSGLSKGREEFGFGSGFLSFKDVFGNYFAPRTLTQLVNSTEIEKVKHSVLRGDVFLTRTSETMDELGMSCVALFDYPGATFNGFTKRLRPKPSSPIWPEYAGYYFRSPFFRSSVTAMSSMSTRASLNNEMLGRLTIDVPPLEVQIEIGSILKALDDRISLLRETNATLEAIAQALFKSWFVDFDPVRAKSEGRAPEGTDEATAALFPDSFEDSPLGPTPTGWTVGTLADLAELNPESWGKANQPKHVRYIDLANAKENSVEVSGEIPFEEAPSRARRVLRNGDTIVGTVRPGNRSFAYIHEAPENLTGSTGFAVLRAREPIDAAVVYLAATQDSSIEYLAHTADGGAYPAVRPDIVSGLNCVIPPRPLLASFGELALELLLSISRNSVMASTLGETRDLLLPRLISGALRLSENHSVIGAGE